MPILSELEESHSKKAVLYLNFGKSFESFGSKLAMS